jgi:hypothetical protein
MATPAKKERRGRGFEKTSGLLATQIRKAGEARGFAVARLLTHWTEIVGAETARMAQPVKVSYGREGFGATLTLLCTGAVAPLIQMRLPEIRDRVNACYGYAAIGQLKVTQTSAEGFAEAPAVFDHAPKKIAPETEAAARQVAEDVSDPGLKAALEALAQNVMTKCKVRQK